MKRLFYGIACAALAMIAAACSDDAPSVITECKASLSPGDLVITEIMANPDLGEAGGQWFEIYNPTNVTLSLDGLVLVASRDDGSSTTTHTMAGASIGARQYLVVGNALPESVPPFMDYAYGDELTLQSGNGRVAMRCDVVEVDAVAYAGPAQGISIALSNALTPDHLVNDDEENWCQSVNEYVIGSQGTPGEANDCNAGLVEAMCNDGGTMRPIKVPQVGDLIITEVMADPDKVGDDTGEWFELYAVRDVDLIGLALGRDPGDGPEQVLEASLCLHAPAGSYVVFAHSKDAAMNGQLPRMDHLFTLSLLNTNGQLFIGTATTILDSISWTQATAGTSINLDPNFFDTGANDDPGNWCPGTTAYGLGDLGTPGSDNKDCEIIIPGQCNDGGTMRPIVSPTAGQATITEYMANPNVVTDANGEWFEVRFDADVDLNGLQLGKVGSVLSTVASVDCLRVTAGTYAIFARTADSATNGGLPDAHATFGFNLVNTDGSLAIGVDGTELDSVSYATTTAGASTSLDERTPDIWCANTTDAYGPDGNTGTPGAVNPSCP